MSMLKYWLWLAELQGLKNQTRLALLRHFSTPEDVFFADEDEILLVEGMTRGQAEILKDHDLRAADRILADCQRLGQRILTIQDAEYPSRLKNIYDPPCVLYIKGRMPLFDEEVTIAVVGTRKYTPYGIACAEKLGYGLASGGAIIISGLAKGNDAAAMRGALRAGGTVVGVAGNGLDVYYPRENRYLYEDTAAAGVLISEYPPGSKPEKHHFPVRNRIMTGLALATLVVEAPEISGALNSAETALEQGKDVFAVPGPIDAPFSAGCNRLIQQGAAAVLDARDILQEYQGRFPDKLRLEDVRDVPVTLGYQARQKEEIKPVPPTFSISKSDLTLTDDQIALLRILPSEDAMQVDDLIEESGIPTRRVLSALTMLEVDQLITQHSGKRYTRAVTLVE